MNHGRSVGVEGELHRVGAGRGVVHAQLAHVDRRPAAHHVKGDPIGDGGIPAHLEVAIQIQDRVPGDPVFAIQPDAEIGVPAVALDFQRAPGMVDQESAGGRKDRLPSKIRNAIDRQQAPAKPVRVQAGLVAPAQFQVVSHGYDSALLIDGDIAARGPGAHEQVLPHAGIERGAGQDLQHVARPRAAGTQDQGIERQG